MTEDEGASYEKRRGRKGVKGEESEEKSGGFCLCCLWNCFVINLNVCASTDRHVKCTTIIIQDVVFQLLFFTG